MKKFAIIAMALMVALAVTACSNNTQNSSSSTPEQSSSQTEQSSSEESSSEEEPSSEAEEVSGDLDENISQPPTGAEDEPEEEISSDKVTPEE